MHSQKNLRKIQIKYSKQLLSILQQAEKKNFHFIEIVMNLDSVTHLIQLLNGFQQGGKPDTKVRKLFPPQKIMIIIF